MDEDHGIEAFKKDFNLCTILQSAVCPEWLHDVERKKSTISCIFMSVMAT